MESRLINTFKIPDNVRKQYAKYLSLELYTDKLVGKGGPNGDITYYFKNYTTVQWTPASIASQFAMIAFITPENTRGYVAGSNLDRLVDVNLLPFCSGMFSYKDANNYAKALFIEIKEAMDKYQAQESEAAITSSVNIVSSSADELKKFKELLDMGIISQEEFDAKKKQLLGL